MREINEDISQALEAAARQEFLEVGYNQASLRSIVKRCGVSTQTIYNRYGSKEGLFDQLVKETAQDFLKLFTDLHQSTDKSHDPSQHSASATDQVLDYIYDHFQDFKLIFCKSEGSPYETYLDHLIQIEEDSMVTHLKFMDQADLAELKFFIHKKATEGMNDLYEIVYHDLDREKALNYMALVKKFRLAGWQALLT